MLLGTIRSTSMDDETTSTQPHPNQDTAASTAHVATDDTTDDPPSPTSQQMTHMARRRGHD